MKKTKPKNLYLHFFVTKEDVQFKPEKPADYTIVPVRFENIEDVSYEEIMDVAKITGRKATIQFMEDFMPKLIKRFRDTKIKEIIKENAKNS